MTGTTPCEKKLFLPTRCLFVISAISITCLVTGCASTQASKQIAEFASATTSVAGNVKNAFELIDETHLDATLSETVFLVSTGDVKAISNLEDNQPLLPAEDLAAREKVLSGLATYAQGLSEIMGNTQLDTFDQQTEALGNSLIALSNNQVLSNMASSAKISPGDVDQGVKLVTTAVDLIGQWIIDRKREKGVKAAVEKMKAPVEVLCALLEKDIGNAPEGPTMGSGLRQILYGDYENVINNRIRWIQVNRSTLTPQAERQEVTAIALLWRDYYAADAALDSAQQSLVLLSKTHDNLASAFEKNSSGLDSLISQLVDEGSQAKSFYSKIGASTTH